MFTGDQIEGALVMGAIQLVYKIIGLFKPDQNKKLETQQKIKELEIKADEQDANQEVQMAPIWQKLLDQTNSRVAALEIMAVDSMKQITTLSVDLAKSETKASILEAKVKDLEEKLLVAVSRHEEDYKEIFTLRARIKELESQLEDAQSEAIKCQYELRQAYKIHDGDSNTDHS